jgi:hypothetical protein
MPEIILNRDLQRRDVPSVPVLQLECCEESGHPAAWAVVWRFAQTFDLARYARDNNGQLDREALKTVTAEWITQLQVGAPVAGTISELRAVLAYIFSAKSPASATVPADRAALVERLLDEIYRDISRGDERPRGEAGPYEPGLGTTGTNYGSGQCRLWFTPRGDVDRVALFDQVAGSLLREVDEAVVVSALYLYPPRYSADAKLPPTNVFMLLLEQRMPRDGPTPRADDAVLDAAYDRLARSIVKRLADRRFDHWPAAS